MSRFPKLHEYTKEEILKDYEENVIDVDFMSTYIATRDRTYNHLIDYIIELEAIVNEKNDKFDEIKTYINTIKNSKKDYIGEWWKRVFIPEIEKIIEKDISNEKN